MHVAVGLLDGEDPLGVLVGGDAHARDSECSLGHGRGERGSGLHGSQRRGFRRGGGSRLGDCFDGGQNLRLRLLRGLCGGVHRFGGAGVEERDLGSGAGRVGCGDESDRDESGERDDRISTDVRICLLAVPTHCVCLLNLREEVFRSTDGVEAT